MDTFMYLTLPPHQTLISKLINELCLYTDIPEFHDHIYNNNLYWNLISHEFESEQIFINYMENIVHQNTI